MLKYEGLNKKEVEELWEEAQGYKAKFAKIIGSYDRAMRILYFFDFVSCPVLDVMPEEDVKDLYDAEGSIQRAAKKLGIRCYWLISYVHKKGWNLKLAKPIRALGGQSEKESIITAGLSREKEIKDAFEKASSQKEFASILGVSIASAVRYQRSFGFSFRNKVTEESLLEDCRRIYKNYGGFNTDSIL